MRWIGMALFLAGVVIAGCFAARPVAPPPDAQGQVSPAARLTAWAGAAGVPFGVGLALLVGGGVLARIARRREGLLAPQGSEHEGFAPEGAVDLVREPEHEGPAHVDMERGPRFVLASIAKKLDALPRTATRENAEELHRTLDEILEQDVADLLDRREELVRRLGLARFAEMIGHFAMTERNVARAWSALTDGAFEEVGPCLARAREGLSAARKVLEAS